MMTLLNGNSLNNNRDTVELNSLNNHESMFIMTLVKGILNNKLLRKFLVVIGFLEITSSKPRKMRFEGGKPSTRKTENLVHLTYPHAECGIRKKSRLGHL